MRISDWSSDVCSSDLSTHTKSARNCQEKSSVEVHSCGRDKDRHGDVGQRRERRDSAELKIAATEIISHAGQKGAVGVATATVQARSQRKKAGHENDGITQVEDTESVKVTFLNDGHQRPARRRARK